MIREAQRWNVVAAGRRVGKTVLGIDRLIERPLHGQPAAWFSPSYKMLSDVWRTVRNTLKPVTRVCSEQEHRLELITGGTVDMWSLDAPDSTRGRKYARVIIDEAAMVPDLGNAWNAAIRPALTDLRGDAWFLSTPRGRGYFWELFHGEQGDKVAWQLPTSANPFIDPQEIEAARRAMPERLFRQEYLAEFLDDAGGGVRNVRESVDVGRSSNEPRRLEQSYVLGVDLARVQDWTVLTVLDAAGRQVYHERFNQISWERQVERIAAVSRQYGAPVILDSTGIGDPVFEAVRRSGVPAQGYALTSASKEALIDALAIALEGGRLRLLDLPAQTNELLAYQYELTPSRNVRMNAPKGMHDDCVIALALANWGIRRGEPVGSLLQEPPADWYESERNVNPWR